MGTTPQADVPGNVYFQQIPSMASRASNAADAILPLHPPGQAMELLSAWIVPHASQAGSATNYADIRIINLGTGSAGTTVIASKSFSASTASVQSMTPGAFTLAATPTKTSAAHVGLSYASAGNGIAVVAHGIHLAWRYL